ncbi:MAG: site-specific integrase [Bacteroidaceae bacterium]|nr:site-specific integrase [Bacteroidaceae bacterium]
MTSVKLKFRVSSKVGKEGRVYYQLIHDRKVRHITTPYKIFSNEWNSKIGDLIVVSSSPRSNYLDSVKQVTECEIKRLLNIVKKLSEDGKSFTIDDIIKTYNQVSSNTLFAFMEHIIIQYWQQGQYRTSETYATTLNSFKRFRANVNVDLKDVDGGLMQAYESYLRHNELSPNTISFYLKHLRAVYNRAVDEELTVDRKPFKRVFTAVEKTYKRAISLHKIKQLKALDCSGNASRRFARDMFLFSFYTRGMSFVDIAYLQKKNLKGNVLFYRRKKTNQQLIIHWETCMQDILKSYSAETSSPYLFSIIKENSENPRKQYQNVQSLINRHLKAIGKTLGLHQPLTMYVARHSWASIARDKGVPLSIISEGMGHDSERTTRVYLVSLKTELIDKANRKILNLL